MPPPQQKPRRAEPPRRQLVRLEKPRAVQHVGAQLRLVEFPPKRARFVVVAGIAAERREAVGRERDVAFDRGAPRDILDIGIQSAVLVDDEHRGPRPLPRRPHEVAAHRFGVATRRRVRDVLRLDAWIAGRDGLRARVLREHAVSRGDAGGAERGGPLEEFPAVDAAVAVLVVETVNLLIDLGLRNRLQVSSVVGLR